MEMFIFNFCLMFFMGLLIFALKQKHMLIMLISLEFVMLSSFGLIFMYFLMSGVLSMINLIYLTFGVCEGVLGLSIMISLIRSHGNDYFQSFSILW